MKKFFLVTMIFWLLLVGSVIAYADPWPGWGTTSTIIIPDIKND